MFRNKTHITTLLAAVPYLLLSTSESVTFTTIVERDGSGLRQFAASYQSDREDDVRRRIREASPQYSIERRQIEAGRVVLIRNQRPGALDKLHDEGVSLQIVDITQQPLSVFTHYTWSEQLQIRQEAVTDVEKEGQRRAVLRYVLQMPGTIVSDTVSAGGQIDSGRAVWELTGDEQEYTLQASSRQVRWGYLLIIIYILGFISFQIVSFIQRLIKYRPRKI